MASNGKITVDSSTCKFTIKIDNFNPELGETGKLMSYRFTFGPNDKTRTNWLITIYPKGVDSKSKDYVSIFFFLENNRPNYCAIELSAVDELGNKKYTNQGDHIFVDAHGWGWLEFISRKDLFDKKNGLIKDTKLTLTGKVEFVNESKFVQEKAKLKKNKRFERIFEERSFTDFKIKIQEKSIRAHKVVLAASSPVFAVYFVKYPNSLMELEDLEFEVAEQMINFIYDEEVGDMTKYAKPLLEVADELKIETLKVYCEKYLFENLTVENAIEILKLSAKCHAEELKKECIDFIQKHITVIILQNWEAFVVGFPALFNEIFKKCSGKINQKWKESCIVKKSTFVENMMNQNHKLSQDFAFLYSDMPFSDVKLEVEGKILRAHKNILWGRSTVFKAMFSHDMTESKKNRVVINDFDFQTMQELLRYIYCGEVLNLKEIALDLLQAADKYYLLELKEVCAKSLESNMTVENITAILNIADLHNCSELKAKAIAFIGRNILEVIKTSEWDEFIQLKPELLNQLFMVWVKKFF